MSSTPAKLEEVLQGIQPIDLKLQEKAREHTAQLIMPPRSLGTIARHCRASLRHPQNRASVCGQESHSGYGS